MPLQEALYPFHEAQTKDPTRTRSQIALTIIILHCSHFFFFSVIWVKKWPLYFCRKEIELRAKKFACCALKFTDKTSQDQRRVIYQLSSLALHEGCRFTFPLDQRYKIKFILTCIWALLVLITHYGATGRTTSISFGAVVTHARFMGCFAFRQT